MRVGVPVVLLFYLSLSACEASLPPPPPEATAAAVTHVDDVGGGEVSLDVYFVPGGGAAEDRLVAEVDAARTSIRVAMYNMTSDRLGWALLRAQQRGVAVEVLWDAKQMAKAYNTLDDELVAGGLHVVPVTNTRSEYATVHDKLSVIDGELVTLGSANWGDSALHDNDENLVVLRSPALAAQVGAQLDEVRAQVKVPRQAPRGGPVELYFSPEDRLDRVVEAEIDRARDRAYVAVFSFRLKRLTDALVRARARGVEVFVITDRKQSDGSNEDERLRAAGIPVVEALNTANDFSAMHHKFAVLDDTVVTGAYNWTTTATFHNDEDLAVVRDARVAAAYAGEVGRLWRRYGGAPGLPLPTVTVDVSARCDGTGWGDQLLVVGDAPELGAWDPRAGLPLDGAGWPTWRGQVVLPAGARLRYKLVVRSADGRLRWERGEDREVVLPTDASAAELDDAFRW